ncbi:hypothetical protein ACVIJ6_003877 [Bradyrhizobium sp. USDA 4369]
MPSGRVGRTVSAPALLCPLHALRASDAHEEQTMLDILMLALAAGFFALAIGYTYACERL